MSMVTNIIAKKSGNKLPSFLGYKPMTVLTGSMNPKIKPGDIVIDKSVSSESIKVGDVITYKAGEDMLITHRVIEMIQESGRTLYKTKGDANNTDDGKPIAYEQVVGKVAYRIPYAGYISNFIRSIYGFILFILLPFGLLIYEQLKTILSEHQKEKAKKLRQG